MTLFVASALAGEYTIPDDQPTLQAVLDNATPGEALVVHIDPTATYTGDATEVSDWELTIDSADGVTPALIPPLYVTGSACDVTVRNVRVAEAATWDAKDGGQYESAVMADRCQRFTTDGITVEASGKHHVIFEDSNVTLGGFSATGPAVEGAIWAYAGSSGWTIDIVDSTFADQANGALYLNNASGGLFTVTITDTDFSFNGGSTYADFTSLNTDLSITGGTFTGSSAGAMAPIAIYGGAFSANGVVFDRSSTSSKLLTASAGTYEVVFEECKFKAGTSEQMIVADGVGALRVRHSDVDLTAEPTEFIKSTGAGSVVLDSVDLYGTNQQGGSTVAVYAEDTTVYVTNSRFCRTWGSAPLYVGSGSLVLDHSIFQGIEVEASGQAAHLVSAVDGDNSATVVNCTFAGTTVGGGFGGEITGAWVGYNNVFYDNTYGVQFLLELPETGLDHTLWYGNGTDSSPAGDMGSYYTNNVTADPLFSGFDPQDCSTWPIPDAGSPVADAGYAYDGLDDDGTAPDLGAINAGDGVPDIGWHGDDTGEDTGDTGDTDSGGVDSETADPDPDGDGFTDDDCAPADATIHPGATEEPEDGVDQDCDGVDGTISLGGGVCSCSAPGGAPLGVAGLAVLALTLRRRRAC